MLSADNCDILTDFSLAWMEYLSEETQTRRQEISYKVPDSTDGSSALQFWTIAPYLYDQLVKKGIEEQTAFKAVLDWSASRNETRGTNLDAVYPGVKNLKNYGDGGWFLSKNPDGESHKLAEKVGSHIADHIAPIYRVGNIDS